MWPPSVSSLRRTTAAKASWLALCQSQGASNEISAKRVNAFTCEVGGTRFGATKRPGTSSAGFVGGSWSPTHPSKDLFSRSHVWDCQLRMEWPEKEYRLLRG